VICGESWRGFLCEFPDSNGISHFTQQTPFPFQKAVLIWCMLYLVSSTFVSILAVLNDSNPSPFKGSFPLVEGVSIATLEK